MRRYLAAALCCSPAGAQTQTPLARVNANFVEIHVVALDKGDEPVIGLAASDFHVFDNGVEEKIAAFASDTLRRVEPPAPPLADVISNRLAAQTGQANATVLLIDGLNAEFYDQSEVRKQLIGLLEQIRPEERVAVLLLGTRLLILQDLTMDSRKLLAAVRNFQGQAPGELALSQARPDRVTQNDSATMSSSSKSKPGMESKAAMEARLHADVVEWMEAAARRPFDYSNERRIRLTAEALTAIARYLAAVPGHKSLIWVTSGMPLETGYEGALESGRMAREHRSYSREIQQAMRLVNDCNVAIYTVDARGLAPPRAMTAEAGSFPIRSEGGTGGAALFTFAPRFIDTLQTISAQTGGKAFYGTNDLKSAIRSAMDDANASYTLGFYSHSARNNNSFHTIKVTAGRPGIRLRYRAGFYDHSGPSPSKQGQREEQLYAALASPVDATEIPLDVRIRPASSKPDGIDFTIRVATSGISIEPEQQRWTGHLDVVAAEKDEHAGVVNTEYQVVDLNLTKRAYDSIVRDQAVVLYKTLLPRSGSSTLRILVRDRATGRIGSVTYSLR